MAKYLDNTGVQYLWNKMKAYVDDKIPSSTGVTIEHKKTTLNTYGDYTEYWKFSDGTLIVTMKHVHMDSMAYKWGNVYVTQEHDGDKYPVSFISEPVVQISCEGRENNRLCGALISNKGSKTNPPSYRLWKGDNSTTNNDVTLLAIGRWK